MRFAAAAVVLAGAAMAAESTVYSTAYYTVTSCAATVTNCPAHSTIVSTVSYPVVESSTAEEVSPTTAVGSYITSSEAPEETGSYPASSIPATSYAVTSAAAACPTYSVKTISTSVTTVVPTVIYETVSVPCPTTVKPSSGFSTPYTNGTLPTSTPTPIVTAGASTIGSSLLVAAAAGFAALVLA
jgi:hypothetical protein